MFKFQFSIQRKHLKLKSSFQSNTFLSEIVFWGRSPPLAGGVTCSSSSLFHRWHVKGLGLGLGLQFVGGMNDEGLDKGGALEVPSTGATV